MSIYQVIHPAVEPGMWAQALVTPIFPGARVGSVGGTSSQLLAPLIGVTPDEVELHSERALRARDAFLGAYAPAGTTTLGDNALRELMRQRIAMYVEVPQRMALHDARGALVRELGKHARGNESLGDLLAIAESRLRPRVAEAPPASFAPAWTPAISLPAPDELAMRRARQEAAMWERYMGDIIDNWRFPENRLTDVERVSRPESLAGSLRNLSDHYGGLDAAIAEITKRPPYGEEVAQAMQNFVAMNRGFVNAVLARRV